MRDVHKSDGSKNSNRNKERREIVRTEISAPVRVRGVVGPDRDFEEVTTTVNVSSTGILLETASAFYYRAMRVCVNLPYEASVDTEQAGNEGRVVRITEQGGGRRTVAIALAHATTEEAAEPEEKIPEHVPSTESAPIVVHQARESLVPLVLVCDSDRAASKAMSAYLSGEGYEVISAGTLPEARKVLDQLTPSLLIAEIEGEGMPGYSLCSHCKQTPRLKFVPVMLITSSAYPSDYAKAHSLGAVVCMAKPYKRERLGHVVRLLAPPLGANQSTPPRAANSPRHAEAKLPKAPPPPPVSGRRFRLPAVFGR